MVEFEGALDLKDRKILFELEQDARKPLSEIAKNTLLKKETVFHRIKRLEQNGVIKGYLAELNVYKMGFQFFPVLLKFQNTVPEVENEIFSYLKNNPAVAWLTRCEGGWDINCTLIAKSIFDLDKFFQIFLEKYSAYISEKQVFSTTEIYYFKRGFWLDIKSDKIVGTGVSEKERLLPIDFELLKILANGARRPLVEIAQEINSSPKRIAARIKHLKEKNIIQGFRVLVDFSKIGYKFYKVWFELKNMSPEEFKKMLSYFRQKQNIIWATRMIGYYDLSIEMEVKDINAFREILNEIKSKFSHVIKKHESLVIFEESVMNYFPLG